MQPHLTTSPTRNRVAVALDNFTRWLEAYGETSWDHQSFFAGSVGRFAKGLYYKNKLLGTVAVGPMIVCEAFVPAARRLFHHRTRFPIADAHYAMGFAFLYEATGNAAYLEKAVHFLEMLEETRSRGFKEHCWGYPFDWVTRNGMLASHTPFITTTPYVFEAFQQVFGLVQHNGPLSSDRYPLERQNEWRSILASITRHATTDIKDQPFPGGGNTCSYMPGVEFNVVNAAAYRATMLVSAAKYFGDDQLLNIAKGNVDFVLAAQNADGSWPYAKDGVRDFVDHFHTCFVMKALAKIHALTGEQRILDALKRGVDYYVKNLFGEDGMPRPFSKAPRLTVYKCELYDCAECINLCLLLRKHVPALENTLETVVTGILANWVKPDGSFRSRKLIFGWDNVPMHRWAQSQMFRSLAFYLQETSKSEKSEAEGVELKIGAIGSSQVRVIGQLPTTI